MKKNIIIILLLVTLYSLQANAQSPLEKALSKKDTVTALSLIAGGENPNQVFYHALQRSGYGSLLIEYCRNFYADQMAFFLLRHGAKPDTLRSLDGRTALHIAVAYYACEPLCGAMLDAGANINAVDKNGVTPLMLAARSVKLRLVKFLIEKGANPKLKDNAGKTAYDYALTTDDMDDNPEAKKDLEAACGFNKPGTLAYLKDKVL